MKILLTILLVLLAVFIAWPYGTVYQLSGALKNNHQQTLTQLIDLQAVQQNYKQTVKQKMETGLVEQLIGQGDAAQAIRNTVQSLTNVGVNQVVDLNWVRDALAKDAKGNDYHEISDTLSFAFFESPQLFLVRLGELGQQPTHFYLKWQPWRFPSENSQENWQHWFDHYAFDRWRLTAIYQ